MSEIHPCPLCSSPVRVVGGEDEPGDGGTRHYEPAGENDFEALKAEVIRVAKKRAERDGLHSDDWGMLLGSARLRQLVGAQMEPDDEMFLNRLERLQEADRG